MVPLSASQKRAAELDERLQHGRQVEGGAADDFQDVCGCSLLLQRLREIASARLQVLEQPDVFDRDHRLVGECRDQFNLLVREGAVLTSRQRKDADGFAVSQQRDTERASKIAAPLIAEALVILVCQEVRDMHRAAFERCAPGNRPAAGYYGMLAGIFLEFRGESVVGGDSVEVARALEDEGHVGIAKPCGGSTNVFSTGCRSKVERLITLRTSAVAVCCCSEFRQVFRFCLDLLEQPDVFNGDHRLVSECRDQINLLWVEGFRPCLGNKDHAHDLAIPQQRGAQRSSITADLLRFHEGIIGVSQDVRNVDNACSERTSAGDAARIDRHRPALEQLADTFMRRCAVTEA